MEPQFFSSAADLGAWFGQHHTTARQLHVGFYKRATGQPSITWLEAVDEALCIGWIDGVRRSLGAERYTVRFTPRKPGSIWSAVNIARVAALTAEKRMQPSGLAAFAKRKEARSVVYAYEQKNPVELPTEYTREFQTNAAAWTWFQQQAPWYRRQAFWRIVSAKQAATRWRRLHKLIEASAVAKRL